ncbi:MAG: alpha/beta hydrolase family protein [Candidatus Polarisedimenticolaceae bacterium]|nr:alpha/beta hydrolase family protein [Candidatus Polarisedimenticolaceae bacterium]
MYRLLVLMLLFGSTGLYASDLMRESYIAAQLKGSHIDGEWVELQTPEIGFIALQTPATPAQRRGAVILLHDVGGQPDEAGVIHALRTQLPASGWHLLSLQMPVAPVDAVPEEYRGVAAEAAPRVEAALAHLRQSGLLNVVLVGHGLGAAMVIDYMAGQPAAEIQAVVMVGVRLVPPDAAAQTLMYEQLATIDIPLLDIYGSRDLPEVMATATRRYSAGKKGADPLFRQDEVLGADHQFRGMTQVLVSYIAKWIGRVAPGTEVVDK